MRNRKRRVAGFCNTGPITITQQQQQRHLKRGRESLELFPRSPPPPVTIFYWSSLVSKPTSSPENIPSVLASLNAPTSSFYSPWHGTPTLVQHSSTVLLGQSLGSGEATPPYIFSPFLGASSTSLYQNQKYRSKDQSLLES